MGKAMAEASWSNLFNGVNLDGWVQRGGSASYVIEDGAIVGTAMLNTPNSFLCTVKAYGDFILEYEYKVDAKMNSGVQIRSLALPQAVTYEWRGKSWAVPAHKVHGYQVEIDDGVLRDRWWNAGIYDEGRRQWLFPGLLGGDKKRFTEEGRSITQQQDWNKVRVEATGRNIRTYLNGQLRASMEDELTLKGFIGLQVHSIQKPELEGAKIRWRNLRLMETQGAH